VIYTLAELDEEIDWYHLHYEADEYHSLYGVVEIVEENQRGEDNEGELYKVVTLNGQTFMKTGYYQSYEGAVWDGPLVQVEKREVLREEWVEV
jgi:hypothetical protein